MADACLVQAEDLDDLVQRLAVAKYALAAGDQQAAGDAIDAALATARRLMTDGHGDSLLRTRATPTCPPHTRPAQIHCDHGVGAASAP